MEIIKCPNCESVRFEAHTAVNLSLANTILTDYDAAKTFTCISCGYNISSIEDLDMNTISVFIVGNSISGQRQGLGQLRKRLDCKFSSADVEALESLGYFKFNLNTDGAPSPVCPWVFTQDAWKKAEADNLQLSESQYVTNVEEVI